MRELYEQTIAYWRAYAENAFRYYTDRRPIGAVSNGWQRHSNVDLRRDHIRIGGARAPLVATGGVPPWNRVQYGDPSKILNDSWQSVSGLPQWAQCVTEFIETLLNGLAIVDPNTPPAQWTADQQRIQQRHASSWQATRIKAQESGATERQSRLGATLPHCARSTGAPTSSAIPSYIPADNDLEVVAASAVVGNRSKPVEAVGA